MSSYYGNPSGGLAILFIGLIVFLFGVAVAGYGLAPSESRPAEVGSSMQTESETRAAPPISKEIIRERETIREIVKIRCGHCGKLYDERENRCPHCGA
jgi:hypothetical protein